MDNTTIAEAFALGQVLTDWPAKMNYEELLTAISQQHPDITIWEKYEDELPEDVIEYIESLRVSFLNSVAAMTDDLCKAIEDGDQQAIADRMLALRAQLGG